MQTTTTSEYDRQTTTPEDDWQPTSPVPLSQLPIRTIEDTGIDLGEFEPPSSMPANTRRRQASSTTIGKKEDVSTVENNVI